MSELKLKLAIKNIEARIQEYKKLYFATRRELDIIETKLIEANETKRKLDEELETFLRTQVGENSLADHRTQQIEDFRSRMGNVLERIAHEKPIPYKAIGDLDTIDDWSKSKKAKD